MSEKVESLRDRNDHLEQRKRMEALGYKADIKMLHKKLNKVQDKLVMDAVSKNKGKLNIAKYVFFERLPGNPSYNRLFLF